MKAALKLQRGTIFRAVHDETYEFWVRDEPRAKFGVVFDASPPSERDDIHYFLTTKETGRYLEQQHMLSECVILPRGSYECFEVETAIEIHTLCIVPLSKLLTKRFQVRGNLSLEHVTQCENAIRLSRLLSPKERRLLSLP